MKAFQIVVVSAGIYALAHVSVQSFRHVFVLLVEPRTSVLARYEPVEQEIAAAASLDELVDRYDEARSAVKKWEQGKTRTEIEANQWEEPYRTQEQLERAIQTWEDHQKQIRQLNFFWWCGAACLAAGLGAYYRLHPWMGLAFFLVAFGEMIFWTSPALGGWSGGLEFDRLVLCKLLYSTATFALLLGMWWWIGIPLLRNGVPAGDRAETG